MDSNSRLPGLHAVVLPQHECPRATRPPSLIRKSAIERLECRIAPAYTSFLSGPFITFSGDAANDSLEINAENGLLKHNRFTAGDAGFASDFDFDSFTAGDQTRTADGSVIFSLSTGGGNDTVILGSDGHAERLNAAFTITNTGADGDTLRIDRSAATEAVSLNAIGNLVLGTGINVTRAGDTFGTLDLRTGSGADTVTLSGALATNTTVTLGAGNDIVVGNGTTTRLVLDGGDGNDQLTAGTQPDVLIGGNGNDLLIGRQGDDVILAGAGLDTFTWAPGEGSDTIEGQEGQDVLIFSGANIGENFDLSANGGRIRFFRNVASITMDLNDVEEIQLKTLGGADNINVGDLTGTDLKSFRVDFSSAIGGPDGAVDTLTLNGTTADDDIRVVTDGPKIQAVGLVPFVELSGFEKGVVSDVLNIVPGNGNDNVFVSALAAAKLTVTHNGETSNGQLVGDLTFNPGDRIPVGKTPSAIASGNLIGPGTDLVIANAKSNSISVLLNDGNSAFLPAIEMKTGGKKPAGVALGDFNNDGRLDIAVTNKGSNNVSIFLNKGDGTFSDSVLVATGKAPGKLQIADVTGDSLADLVILSGGNKLTILANDGNGGFATPSTLSTGGRGSIDFALGDFSGDGRTDIAVANSGSKDVTLLQADPSFIFGAPQSFKVGSSPRILATGDIDGDGTLDLAVSHRVAKFVSVLLNASAGGTIAFAPEIKVDTAGKAPTAIALEDIDLDGHDDLVLADATRSANAISVLLNTGPATFLPAVTFTLNQSARGKDIGLIVTDLDDDGRPDFAVANSAKNDVRAAFRVI